VLLDKLEAGCPSGFPEGSLFFGALNAVQWGWNGMQCRQSGGL